MVIPDELEILRTACDGTTDVVVAKDRAGRYLYCNPPGTRMLGRPLEQILGHTDFDFFDAESAAERHALDQRVIESGVPETYEEHVTLAGKRRLMNVRKVPYRSTTGEIVGVVVLGRDVSSREQAEAKIQHGEELLRLVIEALPVGVVVMNANGDVVLLNRAAQHIWGSIIQRGDERYQRSRASWHATEAVLEPQEWASVRALTEGIACLDQLIDIDAFDGARRTLRNSAVPIRSGEAIEGAVVLIEDITDRLRLEAELAHAQKMEAVGRLAGGIAHDFNNLLMVIQGYAEILLGSMIESDPRRHDIDEIRHASDSAAELTRQLLAFGRRDVTKPRSVVLESVVAATDRLLGRVIGANVRLVTRLADPPSTVWIDPLQLEQVIVNLALNARDAMPDGGDLTISTHRGDAETAVIEVRDTGTGMDEHTRERIFEPYFTTKDRMRGSGLGLATVHSIVERAGGTIAVRTELGRGTTFTITLPIRAPSVTDVPVDGAVADSLPQPAASALTILLVEDSVPVRVTVRAMLVKLGYVVRDVASAVEAVAYVDAGHTVDLLLADVVLDGANGRQLAGEIVRRRPGTPVVLMSGYADDAVLQSGTSSHAHLLAKPFSFAQLADAIRDALRSNVVK